MVASSGRTATSITQSSITRRIVARPIGTTSNIINSSTGGTTARPIVTTGDSGIVITIARLLTDPTMVTQTTGGTVDTLFRTTIADIGM